MSEDNYVCSSSPAMVEVAKIELNETELRRTQALEQFRELIRKHPRIKNCHTDSVSLLRFLRVKKYSVMAALGMLEDYLMERKKFPIWNVNLSLKDTQINAFFEAGCMIPLQKDKLGRQVIFYGLKSFDTKNFISTDVIRLNSLLYTNFLQEEDIQVGGVVVIYDAIALTLQVLSAFSVTEIQNWFISLTKGTPLRIKKLHLFNLPPVANFMIKIALGAMSQKVRSRLSLHATTADFLENYEDPDILPKEYGGKVPWREILEQYKDNLRKNQKKILSMDEQYIEEEVAVNKSNCADVQGLSGSFRKLEVD